MHLLAVALGGAFGASLRWAIGLMLNPIFPTLPLGTLAANLAGGYLIGIMISLSKFIPGMPEIVRLAVITGFLGGLTTFSTFSAETIHLLSVKNYLFSLIIILAHVGGSLLMTLLGILTIKWLIGH